MNTPTPAESSAVPRPDEARMPGATAEPTQAVHPLPARPLDLKQGDNIRFPIKLLTVALVFTAGYFLVSAWHDWQSYRAFRDIAQQEFRLAELGGIITHLDEVLTMSARQAAATGEPRWEKRYHEADPKLEAAIKEARKLGHDPRITQATEDTDRANVALVALEHRAFDLARQGDLKAATAVLDSAEYDQHKAAYSHGLRRILAALDVQVRRQLAEQGNAAFISIMWAMMGIPVLLVVWLALLGAGRRYVAGLQQANAEVEARVEARTRELAQANALLQEAELNFRDLTWNISDVFWISSPDLTQMIYVSPAYKTIWGRSAASLYANPAEWIEAIHPADRARVLETFQRLATVPTTLGVTVEYRVVRPDGAVRWLHDRGFQTRDASGRVVRTVGVARDITEQKQAEAELVRAQRELMSASRQAGKAEVATSVLHNVGNVLNSVSISAEVAAGKLRGSRAGGLKTVAALLREHAQDLPAFLSQDPRGRELPDYLLKLAEHLAETPGDVLRELDELRKNIEHIRSIVALQQRHATSLGVRETLSVTELVEDALRINAASLERHAVHLTREFAPVPPLSTDRHQVLQILVNLLSNAKHALEQTAGEKQLTVRVTAPDGDHVRIEIRDNGMGIAPVNLVRIFQHGFTTRLDGHGFGLHSGALAAKQLGGTLTAQSDGHGKGAVFTLELPLNQPPEQP